jgi:hypothetical protein
MLRLPVKQKSNKFLGGKLPWSRFFTGYGFPSEATLIHPDFIIQKGRGENLNVYPIQISYPLWVV